MESATPLASKFGVEIETRIKGLGDEDTADMREEKDGAEATQLEKQMKIWKRHVGPLSADLGKESVVNHLTEDQYKKVDEKYNDWYLTQDESINTQDGLWGVELVSPVLNYPDRQHWKGQLSKVYSVINNERYHSAPDETCALHVHVSIEPTWNEDRVRGLAAAILRYTPQFEQLAIKVKRTTDHAVEQAIANPKPSGIQVDVDVDGSNSKFNSNAVNQYLQSLKTTQEIVEALCPKDTKFRYTKKGPRPPRHYFWNLWPLVGLDFGKNEGNYSVRKTDTVEFRLPPSTNSDVDAAAWIDFVNLFVLAAVDSNGGRDAPATAGGDGDGGNTGNILYLLVKSYGRHLKVPTKDLERVKELLGKEDEKGGGVTH